ncbi:MAG: SGNH/GDSL hydrolase family protein [Psychrobacter sp.]|nr:SGNH/GDSL hydrolase family protein [Psychrobacter sp.]
MVASLNLFKKDMLLAPIYLYQGIKVKRDTVRLPEPTGERCGRVTLVSATKTLAQASKPALQLMIVGDSAAAGVGTLTQQEALAGKLIPILQQQPIIHSQFAEIVWSLQATTGHTSFDILRRLYVLSAPSEPVDLMVLSVGVNDTTANVSPDQWQQQLEQIITIAQRKFGARKIVFSSLPPMAQMPALPAPLNAFIGAKAMALDKVLQNVCQAQGGVHYMAADFAMMAEMHSGSGPIDSAAMFASDGFHPSSLTYGLWAQQLAALIAQLLER